MKKFGTSEIIEIQLNNLRYKNISPVMRLVPAFNTIYQIPDTSFKSSTIILF